MSGIILNDSSTLFIEAGSGNQSQPHCMASLASLAIQLALGLLSLPLQLELHLGYHTCLVFMYFGAPKAGLHICITNALTSVPSPHL